MENLTQNPTPIVPRGTFKIDTEAKFFEDFEVNPSAAVWNLIISIRDCRLYSKGIKPHRNWKISDVKWYFGIKGDAEQLAYQLEWIKENVDRNN